MFLLLAGTSDVEQIGLELSLKSEAPPADHGSGSGKLYLV